MPNTPRDQHSLPIVSRRGALTLVSGLAVGALAACSGAQSEQVTTSQPTVPTPALTTTTTSSSPTTTATSAAEGTAFKGGPALGVKVDHTPASYPRAGLGSADVVYVEPVEAGLTRMLAIFSSEMPSVVGPIRSARESDVQLVQPFGPIAFAFSGASAYTLSVIERGPQVTLLPDGGFHRDSKRHAPYNLMGEPAALIRRAGGSVAPRDPGFRFSATQPSGGASGRKMTARWSGCTMDFAWSDSAKAYTIRSDGKVEIDALTGKPVMAPTIVVQTVNVTLSSNRDVNGVQTPILNVVGSGPVTVLRGGQAFTGTWSRASASSGTIFRTNAGATIPVAPGPIWVLLLPSGRSPIVS